MGDKKKEALIKFNRDNILDAAKRLFEQQGINETTMNDIAKEADYSKATIYAYFKSKDEIYNNIVCEYMKLLKDNLQETIQNNLGFEQCYFAICSSLVEFAEKYSFYFNSLIWEINADMQLMKEDVALYDIYNIGEEINEIILNLLKIGIEKKILREDIELMPTVFFMWSSLSGIIQLSGDA